MDSASRFEWSINEMKSAFMVSTGKELKMEITLSHECFEEILRDSFKTGGSVRFSAVNDFSVCGVRINARNLNQAK